MPSGRKALFHLSTVMYNMYNASAVKIYKATNSLLRFEKMSFFYFEKSSSLHCTYLQHTVVVVNIKAVHRMAHELNSYTKVKKTILNY
jgi:hypothetical protein